MDEAPETDGKIPVCRYECRNSRTSKSTKSMMNMERSVRDMPTANSSTATLSMLCNNKRLSKDKKSGTGNKNPRQTNPQTDRRAPKRDNAFKSSRDSKPEESKAKAGGSNEANCSGGNSSSVCRTALRSGDEPIKAKSETGSIDSSLESPEVNAMNPL